MEDGEMKKRALVVVLLMMGLLALLAGIAQADWRTCTISQAGSYSSGYVIQATDLGSPVAFTNTTFVIDESGGRGKEMYAAALTAFANSTNLQIWVDAPYSAFSVVWGALATK